MECSLRCVSCRLKEWISPCVHPRILSLGPQFLIACFSHNQASCYFCCFGRFPIHGTSFLIPEEAHLSDSHPRRVTYAGITRKSLKDTVVPVLALADNSDRTLFCERRGTEYLESIGPLTDPLTFGSHVLLYSA